MSSQNSGGFVETQPNVVPVQNKIIESLNSRNSQYQIDRIKSNDRTDRTAKTTKKDEGTIRQTRYGSDTENQMKSTNQKITGLGQRHMSQHVPQQYKNTRGERVKVAINSPRLTGNQALYTQMGIKQRNSLAQNEGQALQQFRLQQRNTTDGETDKTKSIITTNNKGPGARHRKDNQFYKLQVSNNNDIRDLDDMNSANSAAEGSIDSISKVMSAHSMKDLRAGENVRIPKINHNKTLSKVLNGQHTHYTQTQRNSIDHINQQKQMNNSKNNKGKLVPHKPKYSSFITPNALNNKRLNFNSQQNNLLKVQAGDISDDVSSEENSDDDEDQGYGQQSRYHRIMHRQKSIVKSPEQKEKDEPLVMQSFDEISIDKFNDKLDQYKTVEKKKGENIESLNDDSGQTMIQLTPFQNKLPTPKPMPKPFNPPRNLILRKQQSSGQRKGNKKQVACKPLPNPRNVNNLIKNTIIGDSLYSEDDNSADMDSFESSQSQYQDKSEDNSQHSSVDDLINSKKKKRKVNYVKDARNRKNLFNTGKSTRQLSKKKKEEPMENYDESIESSARVNKIQVSGYSSRQHEGSMNLKQRLNSMTRNHKKLNNDKKTMESKFTHDHGNMDNDIDENICDDIYMSLKKINKVKKKSLCQIDIDKYRSDENSKFKFNAKQMKNNLDSKAIDYQTTQDEFNEQYYSKIDKAKISPVYGPRKSLVASKRRLSCSDATPAQKHKSPPQKNMLHSATADSCDANLDYEAFNASCEINSVTTNNRKQSLAINRHYFEISMRFKQLKDVPFAKIQNHQSLKSLDLSHNNITSIPPSIWNYIPNLQKLILDYNQLKDIPVLQSQLERLQLCSLSNNKITQFPSNLYHIQTIITLQLNDNQIAEIPLNIQEFKSLNNLFLHNNPIPKLPCTLNQIWDNLQEFSIDWLSYLLPFVGKMITKTQIYEADDSDISSHPDQKMKKLNKNKSQSFISGINNTQQSQKTNNKEKVKQTFNTFKKMMIQFINNKQQFFSFTDFLVFFNRNRSEIDSQVIKNLRYKPKSRNILHQLAEDDKLCLIMQILTQNPDFDINEMDDENSTALIIALKNKHLGVSRYLIRNHQDKIDILIKSRKLGNAINLAIKSQEFEVIDLILNHKQIQRQDSYILNYIIPNFEKNPTENAKYIVKLILEKGMDPNKLRQKPLNKDLVPKNMNADDLPDKILDISPISLACMKYQNNAFNFIVKFNNTIREIKLLQKKIEKHKHDQNQFMNARHFMDPDASYHQLINQIERSKQSRVKKFFTYIEDISKIQNKSKEKIIQENLKLFDFNQLSGPNKMHAVHYAVQANNLKAIEKFKKIQYAENINFSVRDGVNFEMPQEFAAPSAPIYKMIIKIQRNTAERKKIQLELQRKQKSIEFDSILQEEQRSIGESQMETYHQQFSQGDYLQFEHNNVNRRHFNKPSNHKFTDILKFDQSSKRYRSQIERTSYQAFKNKKNQQMQKSINMGKMQYKPFQIEQKGIKTPTSNSIGYKAFQRPENTSNVSNGTVKNTPNLPTSRSYRSRELSKQKPMKSKVLHGNDDTINIQDTSIFSYGHDVQEIDPEKPDTPPMVKNMSYVQNKKFMRKKV